MSGFADALLGMTIVLVIFWAIVAKVKKKGMFQLLDEIYEKKPTVIPTAKVEVPWNPRRVRM